MSDQPSHRKSRREKPRIELAPDQPLTTQGRPRARVYVACVQCRTRKIRCDGAKPTCHNCTRRAKPVDPCVYDAAPKRRGPDKTPGARQRTSRETRQDTPIVSRHPHRKRPDSHSQILSPSSSGPYPPPQPCLVLDPQLADMSPCHSTPATASPRSAPLLVAPGSVISDPLPVTSSQGLHNPLDSTCQLDFYSSLDPLITPPVACDADTSKDSSIIPPEPSLDFIRQTWWDSLLTLYDSSCPSLSIPMSRRQQAAHQVTTDLRFLLRSSTYWLSFINAPRLLSIYFDPERRIRMQPSFLPAALAVSTFSQSSEAGFGARGRQKAIRLRDIAQGALEASLNAHWIDEELAQAAWLLALFEVCAHPDHTSQRSSSSLVMLDTIIRMLSLTSIDVQDSASAKFSSHSVPSVMSASHNWTINSFSSIGASDPLERGCSCAPRSLGQHSVAAHECTPLWLSSPAWDSSWSDANIRKEICRRLCWSTLALTAGHTSYLTSINQIPSDLFVLEPANFALLFPGEAMRSTQRHSGKDTVWSLNYRTMLLWHSCLRIHYDPSVPKVEVARFGLDAWLEADALEKALDSHGCDFERTFLYHGRECLFNVRLLLTHEWRLHDVNHFFRQKAQAWLIHQASVAQRVVQSLGAVTGHGSQLLLHRPFFVFWFMGQISRALSVWEHDNSLVLALDVGIALFKPVDYLSALWPCSEQRRRSQRIRERLSAACMKTGRLLPPPCPLGTVVAS